MAWMVWTGLCRREGANADIAGWERFAVRKGFGAVEWCDRLCDFGSVELERGWTFGGFNGHFLVTDFDAHRLGCFVVARMFQEAGGVNVGAHEQFTKNEFVGGLRCPAVIMLQRWSGQLKAVGGAGRWTAVELDGQMTFISAHLLDKEKKLRDFEAI